MNYQLISVVLVFAAIGFALWFKRDGGDGGVSSGDSDGGGDGGGD